MIPAAAPPSPQEVHHKLSIYPVPKGAISAMKPIGAAASSTNPRTPGPGTESDSTTDSVFAPDVFSANPASAAPIVGSTSSLPPLSSIAERHSGSGEDSEDEDEQTQGAAATTARDSVGENVIKSGYLWKKGERRKTWKKRWFVLRPAHLAYYKTSAEYELLRLLDLADVHSCTKVTLKRHENTFGLVSPVRTFYLQADSQSEVQEWVKALEDARQALMATSTQNSNSGSITIPTTARARSDSLSFTPSPPHHHHHSHAHNITSSDSDDPSPHALPTHPSNSSQTHAVSSSPSKTHFHGGSDPAKIVLSGYLMKCGSKLRNWRKRWFILTGEHLMYTGSHMDTKPHRKFQFSEIIDALEYDLPAHHRYNPALGTPTSPPAMPGSSASDDADDGHNKHTFKIITTKRTLLVCAPSEEEEIKWLGAVRALIARRSGTGAIPGDSGGGSAGKSTA